MSLLKPARNNSRGKSNIGRKRPDLSERNRLNAKHRMTHSTTWKSWKSMRDRCLRKTDKDYKNYGGRGINVCAEWLSFEQFYKDMGDRPQGKTLGRKDNNGDYCKENCRWESSSEQLNNRRVSRYIEHNGEKKTIAEWAKAIGVSRQTIRYRLEAGWKTEDVISPVVDGGINRLPGNNFNRYLEFEGKKMTVAQWARELGMRKTTLLSRLSSGWSIQKALTEKIDRRYSHAKAS